MPSLAKLRVLRQWAGLCDMTPDFSPIMGVTPVKGFLVDVGWGTYGFKAGPVAGEAMAELIATDKTPRSSPCSISPGSPKAASSGRRERRPSATEPHRCPEVADAMIVVPCPWCGPRNAEEFRFVGDVRAAARPGHGDAGGVAAYLYLRRTRPAG